MGQARPHRQARLQRSGLSLRTAGVEPAAQAMQSMEPARRPGGRNWPDNGIKMPAQEDMIEQQPPCFAREIPGQKTVRSVKVIMTTRHGIEISKFAVCNSISGSINLASFLGSCAGPIARGALEWDILQTKIDCYSNEINLARRASLQHTCDPGISKNYRAKNAEVIGAPQARRAGDDRARQRS